jgi:hypothetical protein
MDKKNRGSWSDLSSELAAAGKNAAVTAIDVGLMLMYKPALVWPVK